MRRQTKSRFHLRSNSLSWKTSPLNENKIKSLPFEPLIKTDGFPCVTVAVRMRRSRRSSEVQSLNTEYMLFQLHNKRRLMSVGPDFRSTLCVQIGRLFCVPVGIKSHLPICVCASSSRLCFPSPNKLSPSPPEDKTLFFFFFFQTNYMCLHTS